MKYTAFFKSLELDLESTSLEEALKRARAIEKSVKELGKLVAIEEVVINNDMLDGGEYESSN